MKPTIKKIILEFENVPENKNKIVLEYNDYLDENGSFIGKIFELDIGDILKGVENELVQHGAVQYQLGHAFYRWLGACKVRAMREAEHPEETDWEDGLVDLEEDLYGNVLDDSGDYSHEWFDPLDPY